MHAGDTFVVCKVSQMSFNTLNSKCTVKGPDDASYILKSYAGKPKLGCGGDFILFLDQVTMQKF